MTFLDAVRAKWRSVPAWFVLLTNSLWFLAGLAVGLFLWG